MIVGCYILHLYCDAPGCARTSPGEFTGRTFPECAAGARKEGWRVLQESNITACPSCARKYWWVGPGEWRAAWKQPRRGSK